MASTGYALFPGGKGANQSIALGRAGAAVYHAGKIGEDGAWFIKLLRTSGVNARHVEVVDGPSGHAIIQVAKTGENAIVLFGGANQHITRADIRRVLPGFSARDYLLVQNETSAVADAIALGARRGLYVVFNPAPMNKNVLSLPLRHVSCFIVNEIEGAELTGEKKPDHILDALGKKFPKAETVLTLGAKGAMYGHEKTRIAVAAPNVKAIDTTAAGDTFIGYFLAQKMAGKDTRTCLEIACAAAAVCVTRKGAAASIPWNREIRP